MSDAAIPDWVKSRVGGAGKPERYPLSTMKVGELHRVPVEEQKCKYTSLRVLVSIRGKKLGRKFYTRVNPDDGAFEIFRSA